MRHIKTWVRNSIWNGRLRNVAVLAIEREDHVHQYNEKIIDAFAAAHQNRRIALSAGFGGGQLPRTSTCKGAPTQVVDDFKKNIIHLAHTFIPMVFFILQYI